MHLESMNTGFDGKLGKLRFRTENQLPPGCPSFDGKTWMEALALEIWASLQAQVIRPHLTWQRGQQTLYGLVTLGSGRQCSSVSGLVFLFRHI